jgi:hypothetical protein
MKVSISVCYERRKWMVSLLWQVVGFNYLIEICLLSSFKGIAVVQLASSLAQGCLTLHEFWCNIQEAPEEVNGIANDLKFLSHLLYRIADEHERYPFMINLVEHCQTKVKVHDMFSPHANHATD